MNATPTRPSFTLPDWMQPQQRAIDWGLLVMLILALLSAWPFLVRPGLPRETDAELHVFRTAELIYCIEHGVIYPRWAPNFWYGYGYPFFNYYGSATYYLAAGFGLLTGSGAVGGVRFVFVLGQVLAGVGTYAFVRRRWNACAGVVAGTVYVYSPYVALIDPHMRGDLAEAFALGLLPVVFWAFDRVLRRGHKYDSIIAAGALAALIFTHNLMAVIIFALLVGWLLWAWLLTRRRASYGPQRWGQTWITLGLGVLLAGFFWAPVLLESGAVQLNRLTGPGHFDYQNHFVGLGELLAPSPPLDLAAANPAFLFNLGLVTWVLALLGCAVLVVQAWRGAPPLPGSAATLDTWQRRLSTGRMTALAFAPGGLRDILYFAAVGAALIFLMTPASAFIWQAVPYMPVLQFPWRLLGAASFCLAVLAGASTRWLRYLPRPARSAALGALVGAVMFGALTVLHPPEWDADFGPTDPAAYIQFELSGVAVGTTAGGEFLPRAASKPPGPERSLIESYTRPGPIDKVDRAALPPQAVVDVVHHGPTEDVFSVRTAVPFLLRIYTFAFDGWKVEVNDIPVEYQVDSSTGFIMVPLREGSAQKVRVYLDLTPAHVLGRGLSLAAVAGLTGLYVIVVRRPCLPTAPRHLLPERMALAVVVMGLLFAGARALSGERPGPFYLRSTPGAPPLPAMYAFSQPFENGIELLAYDLPRIRVRAGETLPVTLYWRAARPLDVNYQSFVHLAPLGSDAPAAQQDKLNPGDYPTTRWTPARYIRDVYEIDLPGDLAPGRYLLLFGLYDMNTDTDARVMTAGPSPDDKGVLPVFVEVLP
ncbi:MAG: hypothetical protein JXB47_00200 [Anaerolineae bacterium]|nr:hypothetical protein [Anaerolineae bacterium]